MAFESVFMTDDKLAKSDPEYDKEALRLMHEDASKVLEWNLQIHDAHQKKAIKFIQVDGVVLSLLLAAGSQIGLSLPLLFGGAMFVISALLSGLALHGHTLAISLSTNQITSNIENGLDECQYLRWYLEGYYHEALTDISEKTADRARQIRYSLYFFFMGLILTAIGIVIQLPMKWSFNG